MLNLDFSSCHALLSTLPGLSMTLPTIIGSHLRLDGFAIRGGTAP